MSTLQNSRHQELRIYMSQLPSPQTSTIDIEQLLAKLQALQTEIETLRKINLKMQEELKKVTCVVTDADGNVLPDKSDQGWEHYFPSSSWYRGETDYD